MRFALLLLLAVRLMGAEGDLPQTLDAAREQLRSCLQLIADGKPDEGVTQLIEGEWYISNNRAKELDLFRNYLGKDGELSQSFGTPQGITYIGTSYLTELDATVAYGVIYEHGLLPFAFGLFKTPAGYKLNLIKFGNTAAVEMLPFQRVEGR